MESTAFVLWIRAVLFSQAAGFGTWNSIPIITRPHLHNAASGPRATKDEPVGSAGFAKVYEDAVKQHTLRLLNLSAEI